MATEFKRMIIKLSDIEGEVATIPVSDDHTDGSWITTDIYVGELFLNIEDNILQTRTSSGIETLITAGGGVAWGAITGTLSSQADLQAALDGKATSAQGALADTALQSGDNISALVNDAGYLVANAVDSVNGQTGVVVLTSSDIGLGNVDNTSDADKPVSTAQQTEIDTKQDTLVSGTNIKTVNGNTLLGSGDLSLTLGATAFTGLSDAPSSYIGYAETFVKVKEDLTGLEFAEKEDDTLITTIVLGTSRDLLLTDKNKNIENDADRILTGPPNAKGAFPTGTQIGFTKKFESLEIAEGAGVTVNSVDNLVELDRINCGASLLKIGTDEWNLIGELK